MISSNKEGAVQERYAAGAACCEPSLCCPVDYDPQYLKVIPSEVIERDYGCGDPSRYLHPGETVLDLGSGTGKICFIASQVVGPKGRVIGVDMTDAMLDVARRNAPIVAERIGYANVEFKKGRIQDLALDLAQLDAALQAAPISGAEDFLKASALVEELRTQHPLIASESVDVVVSNCVLNLVEPDSKRRLFEEIFRVLRRGGRAVISDIVSDEEVPAALQNDPELWSGCISGALTEDGFLDAFESAGFYGIRILKRDEKPWRTVEGIEFRSLTIEAFKGKDGPSLDRNQAVIYKGPFKAVLDDDDHHITRGLRHAVSDKVFELYKKPPYREFFEFIEPHDPVPEEDAPDFDEARETPRHPRETKNGDSAPDTGCCGGGSCC
jgi:ubiquinone/menaquinone biosynthesis C-methylase UbiE